jgi:hypothetical protein
VGVVCLWLGRLTDRRFIARRLSAALIQHADKLMYEAKQERASHIYLARVRVEDGQLVEITEDNPSTRAQDTQKADRRAPGTEPEPHE